MSAEDADEVAGSHPTDVLGWRCTVQGSWSLLEDALMTARSFLASLKPAVTQLVYSCMEMPEPEVFQ